MRWYQFQLRKPKRWGRRAKSDGSANPSIRRLKCIKKTRWFRLSGIGFFCVWFFCLFVPAAAVIGYIEAARWAIAPLLGIDPLGNAFGVILQYGLWATRIGMILFLILMTVQVLGYRSEKKRAVAHRCHLCPRCGYDLQSRTDDAQPCPECGQRISRREAVRLWARFVS